MNKKIILNLVVTIASISAQVFCMQQQLSSHSPKQSAAIISAPLSGANAAQTKTQNENNTLTGAANSNTALSAAANSAVLSTMPTPPKLSSPSTAAAESAQNNSGLRAITLTPSPTAESPSYNLDEEEAMNELLAACSIQDKLASDKQSQQTAAASSQSTASSVAILSSANTIAKKPAAFDQLLAAASIDGKASEKSQETVAPSQSAANSAACAASSAMTTAASSYAKATEDKAAAITATSTVTQPVHKKATKKILAWNLEEKGTIKSSNLKFDIVNNFYEVTTQNAIVKIDRTKYQLIPGVRQVEIVPVMQFGSSQETVNKTIFKGSADTTYWTSSEPLDHIQSPEELSVIIEENGDFIVDSRNTHTQINRNIYELVIASKSIVVIVPIAEFKKLKNFKEVVFKKPNELTVIVQNKS